MVEDALEIMEPGTPPTESQLEQVAHDEELREACQDVLLARSALLREGAAPDVEAALTAFWQKEHETARVRPLRSVRWWGVAVMGTAAALLLLFHQVKPSQEPEMLFQATADESVIMLAANSGETVPFSLQRAQDDVDDHVVSDISIATMPVTDTLRLTVPHGKTCQVTLPDGSQVYLHPGSRLTYPTRFFGTQREVMLRGQAYFVVQRDTEHPFVVTTSRSVTTVLGTEFDVTSYDDMPERVTLVTGSVALRPVRGGEGLTLCPNEQGVLEEGSGLFTRTAVDTDGYVMWRDGYFYYDHATLREILQSIGRCYNVSIACYGLKSLDCRMRFVLRRDVSLEEALRNLNMMKKCHASMAEGMVVVKP